VIESRGLLSWPSAISGAIKIDPTAGPLGLLRCLLVELSATRVLIQVGLGIFDQLAPLRRLGPQRARAPLLIQRPFGARQQLEARGIASDGVGHIIATHSQSEDFGGINDFPNAVVHALPNRAWRRFSERFADASQRVAAPLRAACVMNGFKAHRLEIPELEAYLVEFSDGPDASAGVLLKFDGQSVLHVGDAIDSLDELTDGPLQMKDWLSLAFARRPFQRLLIQQRLRRWAETTSESLTLVAARGATAQLVFGPPPSIQLGFL
jgi:hypothetical protein